MFVVQCYAQRSLHLSVHKLCIHAHLEQYFHHLRIVEPSHPVERSTPKLVNAVCLAASNVCKEPHYLDVTVERSVKESCPFIFAFCLDV